MLIGNHRMNSKGSGAPEPFSLSPMLALLPRLGSASRLELLVTSLFARHEAVEAQREVVEGSDRKVQTASEAAMLRQILDWLSVQTGRNG